MKTCIAGRSVPNIHKNKSTSVLNGPYCLGYACFDDACISVILQASEQATSHRNGRVVKMLDNFTISGPNGVHTCIVFELMGPSLLSLIIRSKFEGLPINNVKTIIKQVPQCII